MATPPPRPRAALVTAIVLFAAAAYCIATVTASTISLYSRPNCCGLEGVAPLLLGMVLGPGAILAAVSATGILVGRKGWARGVAFAAAAYWGVVLVVMLKFLGAGDFGLASDHLHTRLLQILLALLTPLVIGAAYLLTTPAVKTWTRRTG